MSLVDFKEIAISPVTIFDILLWFLNGSMSLVKIKKRLCRPVKFNYQGPRSSNGHSNTVRKHAPRSSDEQNQMMFTLQVCNGNQYAAWWSYGSKMFKLN